MARPRRSTVITMAGAAGITAIGAAVWLAGPKLVPAARRSLLTFNRILWRKPWPPLRPIPAIGAPQTGLSVDPSRYPQVPRGDVVEDHHGVKVADPYRWLEDPDGEETLKFVDLQNKLTEEVLAECETREPFRKLFTALFDYPKFGAPFRAGSRYYYYHNSGLQQHYVLYGMSSLDSEPVVFFDPNKLSEDGTTALSDMQWTDDGSLAAYSLSKGGSDWNTIQVLRVPQSDDPPTPLEDNLEYVKFSSLSWTHDNRGFFYNRYPDPASRPADLGTETDTNTNQLLCYHVLGTPQASDPVIWAIPDHPTWMTGASVTEDGRFLVLYVSQGCVPANHLYVVDIQALDRTPEGHTDWSKYDFFKGSKKLPLVKLVTDFSAAFSVVANDGTTFYITTNLDAPRYRMVKIADINKAGRPASWPDHIPQHDKDVLKGVLALKGDTMVVRYLRDVAAALQLRSLSSGYLIRDLTLPGLGSVGALSGDRKDTEFFFSFTDFVEPGALYRLDTAPGAPLEPKLYRRTKLQVDDHHPEEYVTKQVFVPSRDGTRIPMFITHRTGVVLDGTAPTLLYGYGGFNASMTPGFSASRLAFMRGYNGVFALANLRGGGEYGTAWRDAGSKENKQNVFDDFQACAEFLISERYCSPSSLTIQGGSNGGLLVAACANQRPDLYACVLAQVGVLDMLRFHKFTIGHAWMTDYGDPSKASDFEYIFPYSPLHNVRQPLGGTRQYPAMIFATGDHDDRVVPLHSLKMLATLQYELAGAGAGPSPPQRNPVLARVEVKAGHGAGKPTQKVIDEVVDLFGFAAKCMNAKWREPEAASEEKKNVEGKKDAEVAATAAVTAAPGAEGSK
ncbi:hypothetical protein Vretimale_5243 [Volvox reticuliferus]|uniref:Prolyl endopeptidase n=1 Tax=Volvox reticuliferus TaxID=1737510 RepID=A0A8J4C2X4_9CHLO|nr:hypothetical protein Vretifemale_3687 [Volvox reticuliferus]GIM00422.1 hypothetical protein Vretimale_5243 [Volvox reticuliferus]